MPFRLPGSRINWVTSSFLIGTAATTLTAVPWYIWTFGLDWFQVAMFFAFFIATGLSITLGYHRLFAHFAFQAKWPVRLFTLLFGAAAFENSALDWASDHRRHHKHVDHDDDPYDISKGFWYAHIGWLLFKLSAERPRDNIADLRKDRLAVLQERFYVPIALMVGFVLPTLLGWWHGGGAGALGGFLIAGVARVTAVQHMTFFINSLCHTVGNRPYSSRCSARDSWLMAVFTFGEGYHNYHHEFQHDYRNGVKWWQWDPTKWTIWTLEKIGLVRGLRRVSEDKILLAQLAEARRRLDARLECPARPLEERMHEMLRHAQARLDEVSAQWKQLKADSASRADVYLDQATATLAEMREELRLTLALLDRVGAPA
ncbi:fatty acid desaturase [Opitutales bacterium ASA1]|uniref:fatty acid desaturase n=1 Tax=Congregicoccus parvus TaxID=3081749 RepID=UPI002B317CCE|nr:fatty acid desaturase [Opitutales bacterium ASA1]